MIRELANAPAERFIGLEIISAVQSVEGRLVLTTNPISRVGAAYA